MTQTKTLSGYAAPRGFAESTGQVVLDGWQVIRHPALRYWRHTLTLAARLVRTAGPLAMLLCFFLGTFVTLQGVVVLGQFGIDRGLTGIIVSSLGLREMTLIVGASALGASAGAGFVTELGAMRVSDEIDAIEVMGVHSYPFLVSTRVVATTIASVPIFAGCIAANFLGGWLIAVAQANGMNMGTFSQYFWVGIAPVDVVYALLKGIMAATVTALVCATTGYRAQGGPIGVGMAVGEALNLSLMLIMIANLCMSYAFWGLGDTVRI